MNRILISAAAVAFVVTLAQPVLAQDLASQLVGAWKLKSYERKDLESGKATALFGEQPPGYAFYTKGGHFSVQFVQQHRKVNQKAELTDAESLEAFKSLVFYGGTYKVEGDKLIENIELAYIPSWKGTTRTSQLQISRNTMTRTSAPFKSRRDGKDIVTTTTWERVD